MATFTLAGVLTAPDGTVAANKSFSVQLTSAITTATATAAAGSNTVETDVTGAYTVDLPSTDLAGAAVFYRAKDLTGMGVFATFVFQAPVAGTTKHILDLTPAAVPLSPTGLETALAAVDTAQAAAETYADAAVSGLVVDNGDGTITIG